MNDVFLILSLFPSVAIGGIAFVSVTVNRRSPNCLILLFTLLWGDILPMIAEIHLFDMEWSNWWWLILVNNFIIIPTIGKIFGMIIMSTHFEIMTTISLIASLTFLLLGLFI